MLIEEMWYYQWTKLFNPLTDELLRTKINESQEIIDIAINHFL